jgi:hypothetical protein
MERKFKPKKANLPERGRAERIDLWFRGEISHFSDDTISQFVTVIYLAGHAGVRSCILAQFPMNHFPQTLKRHTTSFYVSLRKAPHSGPDLPEPSTQPIPTTRQSSADCSLVKCLMPKLFPMIAELGIMKL